jgi:hypothetical protein
LVKYIELVKFYYIEAAKEWRKGRAMEWESNAFEKFNLVITKLPVFHRRIAESAVGKKALENARSRNVSMVQEQDVIAAFFSDVPAPFYSMMIRLLEQAGFDYKKYGFPKEYGKS